MVVKEDKCILASGIVNIRIIDSINKFYIFQVLNSIVGVYQAEQRSVIASTIPHLNIDRLKEIKIPLIAWFVNPNWDIVLIKKEGENE